MKRIAIMLISVLLASYAKAQLLVNLQSPPSGYTYKPQLWTMVLTNTGSTAFNLHVEVTLHHVGSGQQLLSGVTRIIQLNPGTSQINSALVMPIQYNISTSAFNIDPSPFGLLPIGEFEVCFHFFKHSSDVVEEITEQCQDIVVEPLAPPQLVYPYDQTGIEEVHPQLSWLPPVPVHLFTNLNYDLTVVEINQNQSAADAIQQNVPLYQGFNLTSNTLLYPLSAPALELDKTYAWRVVAKSGEMVVGSSETWQFTIKNFGALVNKSSQQPYVQVRKSPETAYAIFVNDIKFSYFNETSDSVWLVKVSDLTNSNIQTSVLSLDSVQLQRGGNMVYYRASEDAFFINKHLYQLEIINSRNETWRLRFEFRRTETSNN